MRPVGRVVDRCRIPDVKDVASEALPRSLLAAVLTRVWPGRSGEIPPRYADPKERPRGGVGSGCGAGITLATEDRRKHVSQQSGESPMADTSSNPTTSVTRESLIALLNEDLSREYQAIIAYVVYSQVLKG